MNIDEELLVACEKKNRKAQEKLYKACYVFLIPLCMRYHKNETDARAIYNKCFLKIIKNIHTLEGDCSSFAAWAKRIMNNTLIDEYRSTKNYREKISKRDNDRELDYHASSHVNHAETKFNEKSIMDLLEHLKPATKQVFILYVIEGYNHKEIAEMLSMSEGTSKWQLSTARKELKQLLEKEHKKELDRLAI